MDVSNMDKQIVIDTFISHPKEFLSWLFAIITIIGIMIVVQKKIISFINKYIGLMDKYKKKDEAISKHEESIKELNKKYDSLDAKIDKLTNSLENYITQSNKNDLCILRNNILNFHRFLLSRDEKYILESDLQNYESMFESYTDLKGNGYVHNVIDPYIKSLPVFLSDEQAHDFFEKTK